MEPRRDSAVQRRCERTCRFRSAVIVRAVDKTIPVLVHVVVAVGLARRQRRWPRRHARTGARWRIRHLSGAGIDSPQATAIRAMLATVAASERERHKQQQLERAAMVLSQGASFASAWSSHGRQPSCRCGGAPLPSLNYAASTERRQGPPQWREQTTARVPLGVGHTDPECAYACRVKILSFCVA